MANLYKSRKQYTMTVDIKLFDTLNALSEKTRIPKSKLVDEALELLFKKHNIEIVNQDDDN
ncbi:MAG: ribbon-helix-helix domain-containing protein [Clostridium paraputrificum]